MPCIRNAWPSIADQVRRGRRPSLAAAMAVLVWAVSCPAHAQVTVRLLHVDSYAPDKTLKRKMNGRFKHEWVALQRQVLERNRKGEDLPCSSQLLKEAKWLMNYTGRAEDMAERLEDVRESLKLDDQSFALEQSAEDGSWGGCHKEWFYRLHGSIDPMKEALVRGERPRHPFKFLEPVDTPEELTAVFEALLVSDIQGGGTNHRKELNLVLTGLAQMLFLPELAALFPDDFPRDDLAEALRRFMDERWQDPETGYWGAWYKVDGEIRKTNDLSITFHAVRYRQDDPPRLDKMVNTLFATRRQRYPYGWLDSGTQNNHHAYDVVSLVSRSWPYMDDEQRARSSALLTLMVSRSLALSMDSDGSFHGDAYDSLAEAYYFGVSFLDEAGLFRPSKRYWTAMEILDADKLRQRIERNLLALNLDAPMSQAALRKLRATD